ncbi:hypothetical protein D1093_02750 [Bartonella kosoyi]|uniref:Uncharacterized protein n=1 Tax=Bartonella kosoyi TaxID=2133959 RepID=A0A5B9CV77_9HYPH|nr:hypothetical protein D1093_02750 [Bartonella kosoyi]
MTIKYFFLICAILLIFLSVIKASEYKDFQLDTSFNTSYTFSESNLFFSKQSDNLLNKVILPSHPGNHNVFWENMIFLFQIVKRVYTNLGMYLYSSIFSIFNW